jgi:single-stranded DNA-binding protein
MSGLWALAAGILARDPERRDGAKGEFAIATIRVGNGDAVQWISVIAFNEAAERLLGLHKGDALSVAGRLELRTWRDQEGGERSGFSVVANEVTGARPRPRLAAARDGSGSTAAAPAARRAAPHRSPYPRPPQRPTGDAAPLADRVNDLWAGGGS